MFKDLNNGGNSGDFDSNEDLERAAQFVGRKEFKNRLRDLDKNQQRELTAKTVSIYRIISIAAGFLILIFSGTVWYSGENFSNEKISDKFYKEPNFSNIRGVESNEVFNAAVNDFYNENYAAARKRLSVLPQSNRERFFNGIIYLKEGLNDGSINSFTEILENEEQNFKPEAGWYLAILLLKNNQTERAEELLISIKNDGNHPFQKKASEVLKELNSPLRKFVF